MKAIKANKEYQIDEASRKQYQDAGFDIVKDGKVIAHGRGKTVPYDDYMKLKEENTALRERIAELSVEQTVSEEIEGEETRQENKATRKAGPKKAGE